MNDTSHTLQGQEQLSDLAKNLEESSTTIEHDLYWIESLGLWGCKRCSLRLDKFGM